MATTSTPAPKSGFLSPQFWVGLITILATFALGQAGVSVPSNITDVVKNLPNWAQNDLVPGVIAVGLVTIFIAVTTYIETRTVRTKGTAPVNNVRKGGKRFYQTSEFYLGAITIILNYLQDSGVFAPDVRHSTSTTTLLIALVYTFGRAQLKSAYATSQTTNS